VLRQATPFDLVVAMFVAWLIATVWWLLGVRLLSRAGIEDARLRLVFLGLVLPLGYSLSPVFMVAPAILAIHAGSIAELIVYGGRSGWVFFAMMTAIELVVIAAAIACRRLSAWIVRSNERMIAEKAAAARDGNR
jgi:hypothetical protein